MEDAPMRAVPENDDVPTVLVELLTGEGVVRGDDGVLTVTRDVAGGDHGQPLRDGDVYHPIEVWLSGARSLVGGLVAPGATAVEVVDDRGMRISARLGGGAYAVMLTEPSHCHEPIVCCRDEAGDPVRRPLPENYPRAAVLDAGEPCPACGAVDYEECVPTESWRGRRSGPDGVTMVISPIVVCRRCGHEEAEGGISRYGSTAGKEDDTANDERVARWRAEQRAHRWQINLMTLRAVRFPIYAADGWPVQISGGHLDGEEQTSVRIAHFQSEDADRLGDPPSLTVDTSIQALHEPELKLARQELERLVQDEVNRPFSPGLSDAAITLAFRTLSRRCRATALTAAASEVDIQIDGAPGSFHCLTAVSGRWVAIRRHHDITITITSRGPGPQTLAIDPIADPAARLLGPQPSDP
jgi:hypothetical protein